MNNEHRNKKILSQGILGLMIKNMLGTENESKNICLKLSEEGKSTCFIQYE